MPRRRYSSPTYTPYTLRSTSRRSLQTEAEDTSAPDRHHDIGSTEFLKTLYQYPLMKQALSQDLICYDRETEQFKIFPYPTNPHGRKIEPSGFNSYFGYRRLAFECFCGFLTTKPKFIRVSTMNKRNVMFCMECRFNISVDAIYASTKVTLSYLIPENKDDVTKPITSAMIMDQIIMALPHTVRGNIEYDPELNPQNGADNDHFSPGISRASSETIGGSPKASTSKASTSKASTTSTNKSSRASTDKVMRWEICPLCDRAYREGTYFGHLQHECTSPPSSEY